LPFTFSPNQFCIKNYIFKLGTFIDAAELYGKKAVRASKNKKG
jgi:hypothetical protein